MRLISQSNAQGALAPYHDTLRACVEAAWAHWQEIRPHFPLCSRSGRRHVMHELHAGPGAPMLGVGELVGQALPKGLRSRPTPPSVKGVEYRP